MQSDSFHLLILIIYILKNVYTLGLKNRTAGTGKNLDNLPPAKNEIIRKIEKIINEKK